MTNRLLTNQRNEDIKDLYAQGLTCNELADLYGLSKSYIAIVVKDLPKHFGAGQKRKIGTKDRTKWSIDSRKYKRQEKKEEIIAAYKAGQKQTAIARHFGVVQSYVSRLIVIDRIKTGQRVIGEGK